MIRHYLIILICILFYLNYFLTNYLSLFIINPINSNNINIPNNNESISDFEISINNNDYITDFEIKPIYIKDIFYDWNERLCFSYSILDKNDTTKIFYFNNTLAIYYRYYGSCDPELFERGIKNYTTYFEKYPNYAFSEDPDSQYVDDYLIESFN